MENVSKDPLLSWNQQVFNKVEDLNMGKEMITLEVINVLSVEEVDTKLMNAMQEAMAVSGVERVDTRSLNVESVLEVVKEGMIGKIETGKLIGGEVLIDTIEILIDTIEILIDTTEILIDTTEILRIGKEELKVGVTQLKEGRIP